MKMNERIIMGVNAGRFALTGSLITRLFTYYASLSRSEIEKYRQFLIRSY